MSDATLRPAVREARTLVASAVAMEGFVAGASTTGDKQARVERKQATESPTKRHLATGSFRHRRSAIARTL